MKHIKNIANHYSSAFKIVLCVKHLGVNIAGDLTLLLAIQEFTFYVL